MFFRRKLCFSLFVTTKNHFLFRKHFSSSSQQPFVKSACSTSRSP